MSAVDTVAGLAGFPGRGAGSDAERRAARWLAARAGSPGRSATIETFWCRPNWALAHAWHAALALVGSLLSVGSPRAGGVILLIALVSLVADDLTGRSIGRRLTPERASQNVVASAAAQRTPPPVRLVITANLDAGRTALVYRSWIRVPIARIGRRLGAALPGWLAWLALALVWLLVVALLRANGHKGSGVGALQLVPTVGLVCAVALLLEAASAPFGPAAGDNASGVAAALALVSALDAAPPRRMAVELVLQGAGDGQGIGLQRYLRTRRRELRASNTVVLGLGATGAGTPRWWVSDGALVPLRYLERLGELCASVAAAQPRLRAAPTRGRGFTPALPARAARLPAISIGCLDETGSVPRSHNDADTTDAIDRRSIEATMTFGLLLVDAIDAFLREREADAKSTRGASLGGVTQA